jgi:hypothetical protein
MAALEESSPPKNQKKPKKSKKSKTPQKTLPEPEHTIDVLDDNEVFEQPRPGNFDYPYSLAYQIRTRILELETETTPLSEVNQFNFDLLRLKVRKYHTAYREYHEATNREIKYEKMKAQRAAYEELIQSIVSPAVYERRRLAALEPHPNNDDDSNAEGASHRAMAEGVQDTTDLFVGDKPVASSMDGKENICAICTEHLTENEFGHVYAIESKDEKHSDHGIKCGHKYHRTCISSWAKVHMTCPLCKSTIVKLHLAKEEKPQGAEAKNGGAEEKPKSPKSPKGSGTKKTFGGSKIKTKKRSIQKKI